MTNLESILKSRDSLPLLLEALEWHLFKQETSRSPLKRLCKGSPSRRGTVSGGVVFWTLFFR